MDNSYKIFNNECLSIINHLLKIMGVNPSDHDDIRQECYIHFVNNIMHKINYDKNPKAMLFTAFKHHIINCLNAKKETTFLLFDAVKIDISNNECKQLISSINDWIYGITPTEHKQIVKYILDNFSDVMDSIRGGSRTMHLLFQIPINEAKKYINMVIILFRYKYLTMTNNALLLKKDNFNPLIFAISIISGMDNDKILSNVLYNIIK